MESKHTKADVASVMRALQEIAGDDMVGLVLNHLELSRRTASQLMELETAEYAGARYSHDKPHEGRYSRWGSNPGSLPLSGQKVPIAVPRIRDAEAQTTFMPPVYAKLHEMAEPPQHVIEALFRGLGMRQYQQVAEVLMDSFGLSKSRLSELFVKHSEQFLNEFLERPLDDATYVAMFVDAKVVGQQSIVVAIGVTDRGEKRTLGITQATTEHSGPIAELFKGMIGRGFGFDEGLLIVIDGGKGLAKAISTTFGSYAVVQRCQVHKMANVLQHFSESDRKQWKHRLAALFACEDYNEATSIADQIDADLRKVNVSIARSFTEGLNEVLTLCRLGLTRYFKKSFGSTNIVESANAAIGRRTRHISRWSTGNQRLRWCALALAELEDNWNKVANHTRLPMLQRAVKDEVMKRIENENNSSKASRISTKKRT